MAVEISTPDFATNNITALPNNPSASGYDAATLKGLFDKAAADIKTYLLILKGQIEGQCQEIIGEQNKLDDEYITFGEERPPIYVVNSMPENPQNDGIYLVRSQPPQ